MNAQEQKIINELLTTNQTSFALNGGEVIQSESGTLKKYTAVRANADVTLAFASTAEKGDKSITVNLVEGEVFIFPMTDLKVSGGSVLAYIA